MKTIRLLILGMFLFFLQDVLAQLDTKHWIPPFFAKVEDNSGTANIRKHFVSLSTPSVDTIPVSIRNGFGELIDVVMISRNMPMEYTFAPLGNATGNPATSLYPLNVVPRDSLNLPIRSQGLYFESFQPFFVNMRHKSGSQGTSLTSKGQIALGNRFYSGHIYTIYNTGSDPSWNASRRSHFISVMATEDNTTVTFDMIKDPISYIGHEGEDSFSVTLDAFESYVVGIDHALYDNLTINNSNGTRISSDKPIACNSGSWLAGNATGQCIGSDQIVPADIVGQEYILVRGLGDSTTERPMVIATEDNTQVFVNGNATAAATLDEGEFYIVPTADFSANDNLYILASEKVYMYQTLSGSSTNIGPTVGLNFIPPLNCIGAKVVNLPFVNSLAAGNGQGRINIITKAGTSIFVNGAATPMTGAQTVTGIDEWVTYAFNPPSNNVIIESDSVMNVALLTRDDNVGTAGYFSGFTLEPVVGLSSGIPGTTPCIPGNALLQVFGFDTYQWYFNNEALPGETGNTLFPEFAGSYSVDGIDLTCGFQFRSNQFDIPFCDSKLGAAKEAQNVQETAPGSKIFDIAYRVFIENLEVSPAPNIQVIENLNGGLPIGATAELLTAPTVAFGILSGGVNPNFDGTADRKLLSGSGSLPGMAADAIDFVIRVDMNNAAQDGYFNQVTVTGKSDSTNDGVTGPFNGQDFSHTGSNPDPDGDENPNEDGENTPTLTCFFSHEISYDSESICSSAAPALVTIDGVNEGTFTADLPGLSIDGETGTISPSLSTPGTYNVTFETGGRCPKSTSTTVIIVPGPLAGTAVTGVQICITETPFTLANLVDGEDEGGVWTDMNGNEISGVFQPVIAGAFTFNYTLTTVPCPPAVTSVTLNVIGEPQPGSPVADTDLCEDAGTINLFDFIEDEQPNGQWFDMDMMPISADVDINATGSFQYTYTLSNNACGERSSSVTLNVNAVPYAGTSLGNAALCAGEAINLFDYLTDADMDGQWTDQDGNDVEDDITIGPPENYTYTYTVSRPPCTDAGSTISFNVEQGPNAGTANNPTQLCTDDQAFNLINLLEGADANGVFTDDNGTVVNGIFDPENDGTFNFTYTVTNDECGDIQTILDIVVSESNCINKTLVIPQGFSPNSDGIADTWVIHAIGQYPQNSMVIFSRWGTEVFTARPYTNNWNGTALHGLNAGEELPVGTYWYILDLGDGSDIRKGFVYINR